MENLTYIRPGDTVRIQLPNCDGPGVIHYTVNYTVKSLDVERGTITMEAPQIPGGSKVGPTFPFSQVVHAW